MRALLVFALCLVICPLTWADEARPAERTGQSLSLVVMDPLAAPLSCPCVEGYAQRQYDKLGEYLTERLGRPVQVTFAESFEKALEKEGCEAIDVAIGKDSVVRHDAAARKMRVWPLGQLTGKDGLTTQTGLIVVRSGDAAEQVEDLRGYRILYGTAECDEKFAAARNLLASVGLEIPAADAAETTLLCSDGASKIIEWGDAEQAAAVISSYAAPLLEGCGTIEKGDLRVVAETAPVPFITAFATDKASPAERKALRKLLLDVALEPELLTALESLEGFVPIKKKYREAAAKAETDLPPSTGAADAADAGADKAAATDRAAAWTGWRGPRRDGRAPSLPDRLPDKAKIVWKKSLARDGLGGVAATPDFVVLGDRDASNTLDVWRCYRAADGEELWTVEYPAAGRLDYDNSPRATPEIDGDLVYLAGGFGDVHGVDLATGAILWGYNIREKFGADDELIWGACASPLAVDGKVIVNPGAPDASLAALDGLTGEVIWKAPGGIHAFASPIVARLGGVRQIVACDRHSFGGWDIETGRRRWTLTPLYEGDFNVPTPVVVEGRLLLVSENNGARLYEFDASGAIVEEPVAEFDELRPDMSTPVAVGNRVLCVWNRLFCLDAARKLSPIWIGEDAALSDYAAVIASDDRALVIGRGGELLLVDAQADEFRIASRLAIFDDANGKHATCLSHPALVGTRLYLRQGSELACVELAAEPQAASSADGP